MENKDINKWINNYYLLEVLKLKYDYSKLNGKVFKVMQTSFMQALDTKFDAINILAKENNYIGIFILSRSFFENFSILNRLMRLSNKNEEYEAFIKKIVECELGQQIKIYKNASLEEKNQIIVYCSNLLKRISYPQKIMLKINNDNLLEKESINYYSNKKMDFTNLIQDELNETYDSIDLERQECKVLYPILCSKTHSNLGAISADYNHETKLFVPNSNSENVDKILQLVLNCYRFIIKTLSDA